MVSCLKLAWVPCEPQCLLTKVGTQHDPLRFSDFRNFSNTNNVVSQSTVTSRLVFDLYFKSIIELVSIILILSIDVYLFKIHMKYDPTPQAELKVKE